MLKLVNALDPDAFVMMDEHIHVSGHFTKPLG